MSRQDLIFLQPPEPSLILRFGVSDLQTNSLGMLLIATCWGFGAIIILSGKGNPTLPLHLPNSTIR